METDSLKSTPPAEAPELGLDAPPGSAALITEGAVIAYLDTLEPEERVEKIDDLLHRLNFERRLTLLTPNQRANMESDGMSEAARAKLDALKGTPAFDRKIEEYARSLYFRQCAWVDYLNNGGTPPVLPNASVEQPERDQKS